MRDVKKVFTSKFQPSPFTIMMFTKQVINIEESMAVLTRCSFDESHRQPIFLLGGIPALAELIQVTPPALAR